MAAQQRAVDTGDVDLVVVGAGFAGMYQLHRARGLGLRTVVYEAGDGVGGTWYWNRYPGARCDVDSVEYSYSFSAELEQEWSWSERYATQPEILRYAEHVADRFDLRRDIRFGTRVIAAHFEESTNRWTVRTDAGDDVHARFVVLATGCLSSTNVPDLPGLATFAGTTVHTGNWPAGGVDLAGKRVGIIGTGSSAIQAIPVIAAQAAHLTVFQRTPQYSLPAGNRPLDPDEVAGIKADYPGFRERNRAMNGAHSARYGRPTRGVWDATPDERDAEFRFRWERGGVQFLSSYDNLLTDAGANEVAAEFVRDRIRSIVDDPAVAERLVPDTVIGCKRICIDDGYFATYNRPNVTLVDLRRDPLETITAGGVVAGGVEHALDVLVLATGFDAMTGTLLRIDIQGRAGARLADAWSAGPRTYLGLGVPGFPNLFLVTGPGSPSVLTNMIMAIEQHVDWISDCIAYLDAHEVDRIEATEDATESWVDHVNAVAGATLFPTCNSWYLGANIPGKKRVFMPLLGFPPYVERCDEVAAAGYAGFVLR
jgi:cation diffusion facilitator CzcD-associated flavoprotein CzcO